jgi:hypothetical protein
MSRRWYQFSTVDDERWTFATWVTFLALTAVCFAGLWFVTGKGPDWLEFVKTSFVAGTDVSSGHAGGGARAARSTGALVWFIGGLAFMTPIAMSMIPALGALLMISNFLKRRRKSGDGESDGADQ